MAGRDGVARWRGFGHCRAWQGIAGHSRAGQGRGGVGGSRAAHERQDRWEDVRLRAPLRRIFLGRGGESPPLGCQGKNSPQITRTSVESHYYCLLIPIFLFHGQEQLG